MSFTLAVCLACLMKGDGSSRVSVDERESSVVRRFEMLSVSAAMAHICTMNASLRCHVWPCGPASGCGGLFDVFCFGLGGFSMRFF